MEQNEDCAQEEDQTAVTVVTEHDCEQERESDNREACRVCLTVAGDAISVSDKLRCVDDVVVFEVSRRRIKHFFILVLAPCVEFDCRESLEGAFDGLL